MKSQRFDVNCTVIDGNGQKRQINIEMWGLFFGYAQDPRYREIINSIIKTKEEIGMATELLLEVSQDAAERARISSRKKFLMDQTSNLITAEKRGMIAGRAEIFDLIAQGVPIDEIKKRFGL
jgi:hypothetical protein